MNRVFIGVMLLIFVTSGTPAAASLEFSEVVANPQGADQDREWIEVRAAEDTNLTGWVLLENDVEHGLSVHRGDEVLKAGSYAVIADDAATLDDELGGDFTLLDSVFSLRNTGEALALLNGNVTRNLTYEQVPEGSSYCLRSDWEECNATPGEQNVLGGSGEDDESDDGAEKSEDAAGDGTTVAEATATGDGVEIEDINVFVEVTGPQRCFLPAHTQARDDGPRPLIVDASDEVEHGENFTVRGVVLGTGEVEVYSYLKKKGRLASKGGWTGNKRFLDVEDAAYVELTNTPTDTGDMTLVLRLRAGGEKVDSTVPVTVSEKESAESGSGSADSGGESLAPVTVNDSQSPRLAAGEEGAWDRFVDNVREALR